MSDSFLVRGMRGFASGINTLAAGAIHPAAYVLFGYSSNIESKIPNVNYSKISSIFTNLKIGEIGNEFSAFCQNSTTHAQEAFYSAGKSIQELDLSATYGSVVNLFHGYSSEIGTAAVWVGGTILANAILKRVPVIRNLSNIRFITAGLFVASMTWLNPSEAYASILDSFQKHSFEIGVAATWGCAATFANMILKKMPGINHSPRMRWVIAPVIGFGIIQFGLNMKEIPFLPPKPEVFVNIARQVVVIGGSWKVANVVSQYFLGVIGHSSQAIAGFISASSETIAGFISDQCKQGQKVLQFLDWKGDMPKATPSKPSGEPTPEQKETEKFQQKKEPVVKKKQTTAVSAEKTPSGVEVEDDAVLESDDTNKEKTE